MTAGPAERSSGVTEVERSASDLIVTKLSPPGRAPDVIERPRLTAALTVAASHRLTLVKAPLGYGKTTLVSDWWHRLPRQDAVVAWLTMAEPENDPAVFWRYVVGALQAGGSAAGTRAEVLLRAPGVDLRRAVGSLINDLAADPRPVTLVLDDYHEIRAPACHELLALLLSRSPSSVHVVIASRFDPPLPLGSIRASGQLAELGARDLRLTTAEAAALVRGKGGLDLDDDELGLLMDRTEGWPAALRLAVIWLGGEADPGAAISDFAGDNRHLADYLAEHVLAGLDPALEDFLLQTSVLVRMCAPLCEAVTGRPDAAELLTRVERANLMVVPLDGRRQWYRYHHLFAGLLQAELGRRAPQLVGILHQRASGWHRRDGTTREAFQYAMEAGDHAAAAEIVTGCWMKMLGSGRSATLRQWLERFPDAELRAVPELCYIGATAAGRAGAPAAEVERWLALADAAPANRSPWPAYSTDGVRPSTINADLVRASFVYRHVGEAVAAAQRAADLGVPHASWRMPALATLGFLRYLTGDRAAARAAVSEAIRDGDAPLRPHSHVVALATKALVELDDGDPERAERSARHALDAAWTTGLAGSAPGGLPHTALGRVLMSLGRTAEGLAELRAGAECLRGRTPIAEDLYALLSLAEGLLGSGDFVAAQQTADEADALLELFDDAGIMPAMLAEIRRRSQLERRRRRAGPTTGISQSELAVLRLLAGRKTRAGIAAELLITLNTVKTHTASIYRKLGVGSRAEAVIRAREQQLL